MTPKYFSVAGKTAFWGKLQIDPASLDRDSALSLQAKVPFFWGGFLW